MIEFFRKLFGVKTELTRPERDFLEFRKNLRKTDREKSPDGIAEEMQDRKVRTTNE